MAKFEIALYVLLVVCGAQGSVLSDITDTAASTLTSLVSEAEAQVETVQTIADSVTSSTEALTELVSDVVQDATTELTETISTIVADVTSAIDLTSCLSLTANFEKVVLGIASTAITAVYELQAKLLAKCNSVLAALQDFISLAIGYLEELQTCGSDIENFILCIPSVITSVDSLISSAWTTLLVDISALSDGTVTLMSTLLLPDLATAIENLESAVVDSVTAVTTCITALTSVGSLVGR